MTIDHDTFEASIAELDDLDALPDELGAHALQCDACARRLALTRRIRATARQSGLTEQTGANDGSDVTSAVLETTHGRQRGRSRFMLAAAAAVVAASGAGLIVSNRSTEPNDVLADIADGLRASDGTRFVLATEATVELADEFDLPAVDETPAQQLSNPLPRCAGIELAPTASAGVLDLGPIVDALTTDDPCQALALIADNVSAPVAKSYIALSSSIDTTTRQLDALEAANSGSRLVTASADAYREQRGQELAVAQEALNDLRDSFTSLDATLQPLAESENFQSVSPGVVGDQLVALQARIDNADAAIIDSDSTVDWSQIATGSWRPEEVVVSGTSEEGGHTESFATIDDDPLGLASVLLETPDQLITILESAPASTSPTIEWELPDDLINGPQHWKAVAHQADGRLDDLTLRSDNSTIALTLAR